MTFRSIGGDDRGTLFRLAFDNFDRGGDLLGSSNARLSAGYLSGKLLRDGMGFPLRGMKRLASVAISAAAAVSAGMMSASATTGSGSPDIQRLSGEDRFLTALAVSQRGWVSAGSTGDPGQLQAGAVLLARGDAFPDALAGVPLAGKLHAPILLTDSATLREDVRNEIQRVLPADKPVYILGGAGAVSPQVQDQVAALGHTVVRLGGADRAHTALTIAQEIGPDPAGIFVATGTDFPDALAAGPAAVHTDLTYGGQGVLLLSDGPILDPDVAAYIRQHPATPNKPIYAVGGPATVALESVAPVYSGFTPLFGQDRYMTAEAVAGRFGMSSSLGVATGSNWPDALTGGAFMASVGGPILLPDPGLMALPSWGYLTHNDSSKFWPIAHVYVFGGEKAIGRTTFDYIKRTTNAH